MTKQMMRHCRSCGRRTLHLKQEPPHLLHLFLTVVTFGLWFFVWILTTTVGMGTPECSICGTKNGALS